MPLKIDFYCGAYLSATLAPPLEGHDEPECAAEWTEVFNADDGVSHTEGVAYHATCPKCGSEVESFHPDNPSD